MQAIIVYVYSKDRLSIIICFNTTAGAASSSRPSCYWRTPSLLLEGVSQSGTRHDSLDAAV
jgi:hypothetical protein